MGLQQVFRGLDAGAQTGAELQQVFRGLSTGAHIGAGL